MTETRPVQSRFIPLTQVAASPPSCSFVTNRLVRCTSSRMWRRVMSQTFACVGDLLQSRNPVTKQHVVSRPPLTAGQCQYPLHKPTVTWRSRSPARDYLVYRATTRESRPSMNKTWPAIEFRTREIRLCNIQLTSVWRTYKYRVIKNDCRGFDNLSYTVHLR